MVGWLVDGVTRAVELLTALANDKVAQWATAAGVAISGLVGGLALLGASVVALVASHTGLKVAMTDLTVRMGLFTTATQAGEKSVWGLTKAIWASEAGLKAFRAVLSSIGVGLALTVVTAGFAKIAEQAEETKGVSESLRTTFSGLGDAIAQGPKAYADAGDAVGDVAGAVFLKAFEPLSRDWGTPVPRTLKRIETQWTLGKM